MVTESSAAGPRKRFREMTVAHVGGHSWGLPGLAPIRNSSELWGLCCRSCFGFLANLPHGGAWLHDGQVLADHGTWSNTQLQALVQTHARLIQEYQCVERQLQGPAPAAPVVDQGPQVNSPLLSSFPLFTN